MKAPGPNARRGLLKSFVIAEAHLEGFRLTDREHDALHAWLQSELPQSNNGETISYWRRRHMSEA